MNKSFGTTSPKQAKENTPDIKTFGAGSWVCIEKAWSDEEGWMKSTKALEILNAGCLVQVTTQQKNPDGSYSLAEALSFIPGIVIDTNQFGHSYLHKRISLVAYAPPPSEPYPQQGQQVGAMDVEPMPCSDEDEVKTDWIRG